MTTKSLWIAIAGRRLRGPVTEPYLANVVLCGGLLRAAGEEQRERFLHPLIAGESQWAFAFAEEQSRYRLSDVGVSAARDGEDWLVSGRKLAVLNGPAADWLLVTVRTDGERRDSGGGQ